MSMPFWAIASVAFASSPGWCLRSTMNRFIRYLPCDKCRHGRGTLCASSGSRETPILLRASIADRLRSRRELGLALQRRVEVLVMADIALRDVGVEDG